MKIGIKVLLALAFITFVQEVHSQSRCRQISDPVARRKCLEREAAEANRQAEIANRNLQRANNNMHRVCQTYEVLDIAAGLAAEQGQTFDIRAAGYTWVTLRALLSAVTKERQKCDSARQEVERARRRA